MRFQRLSVLFRYEISMMVGFVQLWDLNDSRFCSFVPLQDFVTEKKNFVFEIC